MKVTPNQMFYWNGNEIIYLPPRYTIDSNGNAICTHTFNLENAFDEVTSVDSYGLNYAFINCTGITGSVSFPKLTSVGTYGLSNAFYGCTGITELHFRADMQSTIGSNKYGATNATVYFDL